jgi:hypothetical protein
MVLGGSTSTFSSGGEEGFQRNLDKDYLLEGLNKSSATYDTFPLGDAGGALSSTGCGAYNIDTGFHIEDELAYCPHVAEGVNDFALNEFLCLSGMQDGGIDVLAPNSAFIHTIGVSSVEILQMALESTALVWSPRSNISLYGHTASVSIFHNLGVSIALGSDWVASGSMNVLREIQCADSYNKDNLGGYFSDRQLFDMATLNAAMALGFDDVIGALAPGKAADITVFRGDPTHDFRVVLDAGVADVALVLRGGTILSGDKHLVESLPEYQASGCEVLDVCESSKIVCIRQETQSSDAPNGLNLADLENGVFGGSIDTYPLFFCDIPEDEPTCIPSRPGEYNGLPTDEDLDGDGISNDLDNCPALFNAPRTMDNGAQPDIDGDGLGDPCDPCPFDEENDSCASIDPTDVDDDGLGNTEDNCPKISNEDQADEDQDGKGDVCDLCPTFNNPGAGGCPSTVYAVKKGEVPLNDSVVLFDLIATAIHPNGFFAQAAPDSSEYEGPEFSGIWVYFPESGVVPGDRLNIDGFVEDYFGELEIANGSITLVANNQPIPEPMVVEASDIHTNGAFSSAYEGVLVEVQNAEVTNTNPDPNGQQVPTNEFEVNGGLLVDDYFYQVSPAPLLGETFNRITGILRYSWNNTKLVPRDEADISRGDPVLASLKPALVYILEGTSGASTPPLIVSLNVPTENNVVLWMSSENTSVVSFPNSNLIIPVGVQSVSTPLVANHASNTPTNITLTLGDSSLQAAVRVVGADESPTITNITPAEGAVATGESLTLTVHLSFPAFVTPVEIALSVEGPEGSSIPASVTVPVGAQSATFDVQAPETEGDITVYASGNGSEASALIEVVNIALVGILISEVYYDHPDQDSGYEWVKLYNGTTQHVILDGYSLGWGGTDYTYGTLDISGVIPSGGCFVIGGPISESDNGAPILGQAIDLDPDMQNSGSKADGVALFDIPASQITTTTIPIDAVVYGGNNDSGLLGPDGGPASVHVGDVSASNSLVRETVEDWTTSSSPNAVSCKIIIP